MKRKPPLQRQSNHFNRRVSRRTIRMYKCMNPRVTWCATDRNLPPDIFICIFLQGNQCGSRRRRENYGVNNFGNECSILLFFSPFFLRFFFSPTAVVARSLMKMDGVFHAHLLKSVETFTSQRERAKGRTCWGTTRPLMESIQGVFHPIRR